MNISFVVEEADVPLVVKRLHQRFFEVREMRRSREPLAGTRVLAFPVRAGARAEAVQP